MTGPSQGIELTSVVEVDTPLPGPGEVAIEVAYAGINFADVMARRGDAAHSAGWPYIAGHEVCGVVRQCGDGVEGLAVGQPVVALPGRGGLAQTAVAPAGLTVALPDGVSPLVAAGAPAASATAMLMLDEIARIRTGDRVLVYSASGGVGAALGQLIALLGGGPSIGVVGRPEQVDAAVANGYDLVLTQDDDLVGQVLAAVPGGVDVVLDPKGTAMVGADMDMAAPGGRIVLFGNASGETSADLPPAGRLMAGCLSIAGFSIGSLSASAPQRVASAVSRVLDLIARGELRVPVTLVDGLAAVPEVHQLMATGRGRGKYVVEIDGSLIPTT